MKKWDRLKRIFVTAGAAAIIVGCSDSRPDSVPEENIEAEEAAGPVEETGAETGSVAAGGEEQAEKEEGISAILEESAPGNFRMAVHTGYLH